MRSVNWLLSMQRNNEKVFASFQADEDGWTTKTGCTLYIPSRYREKNLATFGVTPNVTAIFKIELPDGTWSNMVDIAKIRLGPTNFTIESINGEYFYVFKYKAGDKVIVTSDIIIDKFLSYYVYEYYISRGYIPFYMEYEDIVTMFDNAVATTGMTVSNNLQIIRFLTSYIGRDKKDGKLFYRQTPMAGKVKWVQLSSVLYGPRTTTAKLIGNRFEPALIGALTSENTKPDQLENILRSM